MTALSWGRQPAERHRRRTRDHCGGARPGPQARRLRPPRAPGDNGLAGRAPRRRQPGGGRVGRGRPAVRDRAHPGRGQDRLAPGPERPRRAGLRERRGLRPADVVQGHRAPHHRGVLRRQLQLVGRLRPVGVDPVRPPGRAAAGRRPPEVGGGGPAPHHRRPPAPGRRLPGGGARRLAIRVFRDQVLEHVRYGGRLVDVRSPGEYSGELLAMPDYPQEGRCAAATSPARPTCPGSGRPTRTAPSGRSTS